MEVKIYKPKLAEFSLLAEFLTGKVSFEDQNCKVFILVNINRLPFRQLIALEV